MPNKGIGRARSIVKVLSYLNYNYIRHACHKQPQNVANLERNLANLEQFVRYFVNFGFIYRVSMC